MMKEQPPRSFGEMVRQARTTLGITQAELAERLGVRQPAVSAWERGTAYPSAELYLPLAGVLEVDVATLLAGIGIEPEAVGT